MMMICFVSSSGNASTAAAATPSLFLKLMALELSSIQKKYHDLRYKTNLLRDFGAIQVFALTNLRRH
jgi:hypothetical protein